MKNAEKGKNVEKLPLEDWAMDMVFLLLAYKGIYLKREEKPRFECKDWKDAMKEIIELLRLCLVIKELAEQFLF